MGNIVLQDHELYRLVMALAMLFLLLSLVIIGVMLAYGKRRQKHLLELKEIEHNYKQSLLSSQIEIQEETLKNIGQELHDNISQQLGLTKIQLTRFVDLAPELRESRQIVSQTIEDIRALSKSLHPDRIASVPLHENMALELSRLQRISPLTIRQQIEEDHPGLKVETRIIMFRIFQELMNNALRHSQAGTVMVQLGYGPATLNLQVSDNGIGLPQGLRDGIGFIGIKNRVGMLAGTVELTNQQPRGACIRVQVPIG